LVNLFGQVGPGHLAHPRRITKKSITALPGAAPTVPGWSLYTGQSFNGVLR
jgi:hypothetical protein